MSSNIKKLRKSLIDSEEKNFYSKSTDKVHSKIAINFKRRSNSIDYNFKNPILNKKEKSTISKARNNYYSKLMSSHIWFKPANLQNLVILDWDDTLLCTSYLTPNGFYDESKNISDEDQSKLKKLEKHVFKLLTNCVTTADTFLVTNASTQWIEYSARKYLPKILPLLSNVNIISARETCEKLFPGKQRRWKLETFQLIVEKFNKNLYANIICIGDSFIEMEAGSEIANQFIKSFIKTIKFKESPKIDELIKEVKLINSQYDFVFKSLKKLNITVEKIEKVKNN